MSIKRCIILLLCITIMLTACQPTPKDLVVQQKDNDDLIESIKATATPQPSTPEPEAKVEQEKPSTRVLEHWTHQAISNDGKVTINIDTDVIVPNVDKFPVIGLTPKRFDQKDVDNIVTTFIGDKRLFYTKDEMTKAEIEEVIMLTKLEMKDLDSDMAQSNEITSLVELEKHGEEELARLEKMLKDAPETNTIIEEDTDISTPIDDELAEHLQCLVRAEVDM